MKNIICIRCASIYQPSKDDLFRCPNCSFTVEKEFYDKLINYAQGTAKYGYVYWLAYENDYKQVKTLPNKYAFSIDEIWIFCTLAALSGIIGNVTCDVPKGVMKKIIDQFKLKEKSDDVNGTKDIVDTSDQFSLFTQYITDYYNGVPNVNPKIRDVINEEIYADDFSEIMISLVLDSLKKSKDLKKRQQEIIHILETQFDEKITSRKNPPEEGDFDEFWQLFE